MKQTPGAWTAHAQASANHYVILQNNNWLASIQFNGELMPAKQEEYLNTMAAAPNLLEALETMVKSFLTYAPYTEGAQFNCVIQAKAAIAQAKGV